MDPKLSFIVIGAQKAGTTTMFQHLRHHPELWLPPEKEAPFFSRDENYARGERWYFDHYFHDAPPELSWGTASPDYMLQRNVAERIHDHAGSVRLIALLRDPVQRALSHHSMVARRGDDDRSASEALRSQLQPDHLERARIEGGDRVTYVVGGEYGRVLGDYLEHFSSEQLLCLSTQQLKDHPEEVLSAVYDHLGVAKIYPPTVGQHFHVAGGKDSLGALRRNAHRIPVARSLWHLVPLRHRDRFANRTKGLAQASAPSKAAVDLDPDVHAALRRHYAADAVELRRLTGFEPDWPLHV